MTQATTRPARKRTPAKAAVKPAPKAVELPPKVVLALEWEKDTASYRVFRPAKDSGCVGSIYVPHVVQAVKVQLISTDGDEPEA